MPRILSFAIVAGLVLMGGGRSRTSAPQASAPKAIAPSELRFYPDDPLAAEPTPITVPEPRARALSAILETVNSAFKKIGQRQPVNGVILSRGVNTLGEVMDGDWYVNRQAARRLTIDELKRGPGNDRPPAMDAPWKVLVVKPFGVNPGLLVADAKNSLYLLRFDPRGYEGSRRRAGRGHERPAQALGYHVAENYIVRFDRARLGRTARARPFRRPASRARSSSRTSIDSSRACRWTTRAPTAPSHCACPRLVRRCSAQYQVWGTRSDDPNDIVPHEHRRDLRGLFVFAAWLNMAGFRAVSTQDVVVTVDGVPRIRHS